jgi:acetyl-CoA carboxylase biotin carboxyl carrier protein
MVGTVYMQSQPGSPPFIKVGDRIAEGQTLLIVEAMKTMPSSMAPNIRAQKGRAIIENSIAVAPRRARANRRRWARMWNGRRVMASSG